MTARAPLLDGQRESIVVGLDEGARPAVELIAQAALGCGQQHALVGPAWHRIDSEIEAGQVPDRLGPDADLAVGGDRHRQRIGAARADVADEHRRAAVDEALGQTLVQERFESRASTWRVRSAQRCGSASQSERWAM